MEHRRAPRLNAEGTDLKTHPLLSQAAVPPGAETSRLAQAGVADLGSQTRPHPPPGFPSTHLGCRGSSWGRVVRRQLPEGRRPGHAGGDGGGLGAPNPRYLGSPIGWPDPHVGIEGAARARGVGGGRAQVRRGGRDRRTREATRVPQSSPPATPARLEVATAVPGRRL